MDVTERQPTHPGEILREDYLIPLSIGIGYLASLLGISRARLSQFLNASGSVTPDMALRLSRALGTTPELWLNLQKNYDLWHAAHDSNDWRRIERIYFPPTHEVE